MATNETKQEKRDRAKHAQGLATDKLQRAFSIAADPTVNSKDLSAAVKECEKALSLMLTAQSVLEDSEKMA